MPASPLVTVVIPAFNSEAYIHEAIASVRAQTLSDWELLVVDDGSTDRTAEVAAEAASGDPRIRIIRLDGNKGISAASNIAFDQARGEFIARVDSDDIVEPSRLAVQITAFRDNARLVVCGSHARVFGDGITDATAWCPLDDATIKARLLDGMNTISGGTKMVRRAFVHERRIRFNEQLVTAEDLDYLTSIVAAGGQLGNVDEALTRHRSHAGSITTSRVDTGRKCLTIARKRLLALWYPHLESADHDRMLAMFFQPYAPYTESLIETIRAVDRLVVSRPNDFGQDTSIVHEILFKRLVGMATVYRDSRMFDASHLQAIKCFVSPAVHAALAELKFGA
jgi:glycosyltransferase involved in cell wall biosynthesis